MVLRFWKKRWKVPERECVAIGMAVITLMDNQPNIINYENKIVDKYAEWEQGLKEREETIKQREQEVGL